MDLESRLVGTLLGTALGDALGLPCEGMSARAIAGRFGRVERYHLLGRMGFVSDDTELSALVAQNLATHPLDTEACVKAFRRSLLGWFLRLPWGIGLGTLRACVRISLGFARTGVLSAGNGAAMRSAIIGAFYCDDAEAIRRRRVCDSLAQVTHLDERAVQGARYVAEVAAFCARAEPQTDLESALIAAESVIDEPSLVSALRRSRELAGTETVSTVEAASVLGTSGFVVHTVSFAAFCFRRFHGDPLCALSEAISGGGDTDTIAAIVGAWCGCLHGVSGLPSDLLGRLHDGPFGPSHLRALGMALAARRRGEQPAAVVYSPLHALARNLALVPVVLANALRRGLPW